jgi:perosamine synthetase
MEWRIPLFKIYWDEDDITAVNKAISRGMNWAIGPEVAQFEEKLSEYLKVKYCLTFNSGTSALHAILLAYGIGPGDEAIVPSFTFIATANAALFVGAKPVFADIEEETYGLNPKDVERKITQKTRVIIPMHYGGCPCLMGELKEVAQRHNLLLIEDAAESLGADINGTKVGSIGDAAILSFCQSKIITTGEGGAVVTNSRDIYQKLQLIRSHGRLEDSNYFSSTEYMDYVALGYNFRMSNITAALGLAQLDKINEVVEMRRRNAQLLNLKLSHIKGIVTPNPPGGLYHVYQMYSIRVPGHLRDRLKQYLADGGIMSKVFFYPIHKTHFYKNELKYDCVLPVTEMVSKQVLTLPMYPSLSEEEITIISRHIADYLSEVNES